MSEQRYNGWSNYETWNVALWLSNDPSEFVRKIAQDILQATDDESSEAERREDATNTMSLWLQEFHEEEMPELPNSVYSDLLSASFRMVNWHEIAKHYIDDLTD